MAGTAKTDLAAVTLTTDDKAKATAEGVHLGVLLEVAKHQIIDAARTVEEIKKLSETAQTITDLGTALTSLS